MRLWHEALIPYLPRQQLLGQHRECCALRGKGWGKKHATVNYVFDHPYEWLVAYHYRVMAEMIRRGHRVAPEWMKVNYRGQSLGFAEEGFADANKVALKLMFSQFSKMSIYLEHNNQYLDECLDNLKAKGVILEVRGVRK